LHPDVVNIDFISFGFFGKRERASSVIPRLIARSIFLTRGAEVLALMILI
jgi:hypothetical protein